jgi:hypothetical protein
MSTHSHSQPTYIALPCIFVSVILTSLVAKAMTPRTDKGLITVLKATCAFLLILVITIAATKALLPPSKNDETGSSDDSDAERSETSTTPPASHNKIAEGRDDVQAASTDLTPREIRAERRKLQKQKIYERTDRKPEEKRVRGTLREQLKRRNNELLGTRKETVVEVVGEGV